MSKKIYFHGWMGLGGGGWLEQVRLKLTQSPAKAGVEVGTELGNIGQQIIRTKS